MRWLVHGRRPVYVNDWVELWLDDVEVPGGPRFEHNVIRFPRSSNTVVAVREGKVLLIWRHRFITDAWGWEVPAGWSEPNEDPETAICREIEEETGWRARTVTLMIAYHAISGIGDMRFNCFVADDLELRGDPTDRSEADRVDWIPLDEVPKLAAIGQINDGPTLTALGYYLGIWRSLGRR